MKNSFLKKPQWLNDLIEDKACLITVIFMLCVVVFGVLLSWVLNSSYICLILGISMLVLALIPIPYLISSTAKIVNELDEIKNNE